MTLEEFEDLLVKSDDKLSIFGNPDLINPNWIGKLSGLIKKYLTDEEKVRLSDNSGFSVILNYVTEKRKSALLDLLLAFPSEIIRKWLLDPQIVKFLVSTDVEKMLKNLKTEDKIFFIADGKVKEEPYNLSDYNVANVIYTLEDDNSKRAILETNRSYAIDYRFKIIETFSDKGKKEILLNGEYKIEKKRS